MFAITYSEKGGETRRVEFDKPEVTIGRVQGNDVVLPKGNVSKRHSRIVFKDGKYIVVDLKSTNGTYVNGRKISSPVVIKGSDKVYIGDFVLSVETEAGAEPALDLPPSARRTAQAPPPPPRRLGSNPPPAPREPDPVDEQDYEAEAGPTGYDEDPEDSPPEPSQSGRAEPHRTTRPLAAAGTGGGQATASPRAPQNVAHQPTVLGDAVGVPRVPASGSRAQPAGLSRPAAPTPVPETRDRFPSQPAAPARSVSARPQAAAAAGSLDPMGPPPQSPATAAWPVPAAPPRAVGRAAAIETLGNVAGRLGERLGVESLSRSQLADPLLRQRAERMAAELVSGLGVGGASAEALVRDAVAEVIGAGPLDELLADPEIVEIRVPRHDRILVDRDGQRLSSERFFSSAAALERAVARLSGDADRRGGLVEARLRDGHHLTAVLPPLSTQAAVTIRRPARDATFAQLVAEGALSSQMGAFLGHVARARRAVLIAGEPAAGRDALVCALARELDAGEAICVIGTELGGTAAAVVGPMAGGAQAALSAALRLSPDRLIVGAEASAVALDALLAVPGTIISLPATSGADALARLAAQFRLASPGRDRAIAEATLAEQLDVVVSVGRSSDGRGRVTSIAEVSHQNDGGRAALFEIFVLTAAGSFAATGHIPAFAEGAAAALFKN